MTIQQIAQNCGNTVRTNCAKSTSARTDEINKNIIKAEDQTVDYSKGQALYVGTAQCDPARSGSEQSTCKNNNSTNNNNNNPTP